MRVFTKFVAQADVAWRLLGSGYLLDCFYIFKGFEAQVLKFSLYLKKNQTQSVPFNLIVA